MQSIPEVLAEGAGRHRRRQVAVGRGQHAHLHRNRLAAADTFKCALLQHAQEGHRRLGREVAELVQDDGPAMGRFKTPQPPLQRPGEGAFLMPESFGGDQRRRNGRAVHPDQGPCRPGGPLMNGPRHQFFAGASFPHDEHGGIRPGHFRHVRQHSPERFRGPDDCLEHRGASEVFAQRQVFVAHPLVGLLALVNVRARRIPAQKASLVIPQRVVMDEKPPIRPVVPPGALFVGKRGPRASASWRSSCSLSTSSG